MASRRRWRSRSTRRRELLVADGIPPQQIFSVMRFLNRSRGQCSMTHPLLILKIFVESQSAYRVVAQVKTTVQIKQEKCWVKLVTLQRHKGLSPRLELCLRHTLKLAMAFCQTLPKLRTGIPHVALAGCIWNQRVGLRVDKATAKRH